jgi:hypothetical protein
MENNIANKIIIVTLLLLIGISFISFASALGITPGRTTLDFSPNGERDISVSVINSEHKDMNVAVLIQGELASYITTEVKTEKLVSSQDSVEIKYHVKLPQTLSPGLHTASISAVELPGDVDSPDMLVKATVSVATQLYVYVPYPGKYADSEFNIVAGEGSNLVSFYIPLISRGSEKIDSAEAAISIYKGTEKITTISTDKKALSPGERAELSATWSPDVAPGEYSAVAELSLDGQKKNIEKKFNVGNESLRVMGIGTNNFQLGQVAKITVVVANELSDGVSGASANLKIADSDLNNIADIKSQSYDIPPLSNAEMVLYWDTEKVQKGDYTSSLKIGFGERSIEKGFRIGVSDNSIDFTGIGFVVGSGSGGKTSFTTVLFIIIGILVLINLAWFVIWMRNRHKKSK